MSGGPARRSPVDFATADDPPEWYIDQLRLRFPTEAEVDAVLTRKMRRRAGPPYRRRSLSELVEHLRAFLAEHVEGPFEISAPQWFAGGVSKIQLGFTLEWTDPVRGRCRDRMVLRMDPSEGSNATSRAREYELISAVQGLIPVPRPFFLDREGRWFPEPALIYAHAAGVTKPSTTPTGSISGLGTNFGAELRARLAPQYLEHLALIHTFDVGRLELDTLERPAVGTTQAAEWLLNHARRTWEEDRGEDLLLMEVAANWLQRHLPVLDRVSIVHGDYRSGNFLFDERDGRITAWLDWERGHLGDRHRDLAWIIQPTMGHYEDGTYYVCGLIPLEEFLGRYEQASGLRVDPATLTFHRILNCFVIIVSTLASNYRIARLGKSHQDIVLARVEGLVPVIARELRTLLTEAPA